MAAKNQLERDRESFLEIRVLLHIKVLIIPQHKCYRARVTSAGHVTRTEELKHVQLHFSSTCWHVNKTVSCWRITDQLDVIRYYVLFHFFYAQHVSDINTSIIRSLRLFYCITALVVCSCFDVCWSFGVATLKLQHTSKQEHTPNVVIQ